MHVDCIGFAFHAAYNLICIVRFHSENLFLVPSVYDDDTGSSNIIFENNAHEYRRRIMTFLKVS